MNNNEDVFVGTKEAYYWLRSKHLLGFPETFEALTPEQQDFFMNFYENCREVQCEAEEKESQLDNFLAHVEEKLGEVGETTVENILYDMNLTVVQND